MRTPPPVVAIDTETLTFRPGNMAPRIVCVSIAGFSGDHPRVVDREGAEPILRDLLRAAAHGELVITAHNAAYDFACVLATYPDLGPLVWEAYAADGITCTMLREKLLDIAEGLYMEGKRKGHYTLGKVGSRRLGRNVKEHDEWRLRYGELEGTAIGEWPESARQYPIDDAVACLEIHREQEKRAASIRYEIPTQYLEARAYFALQLIHVWGIHTDADRVRDLWARLEPRILELEEMLLKEGFLTRAKTKDLFGEAPKVKKNMKAIRAAVGESWPTDLGPVPRSDGGKSGKKQVKCDVATIELCSSEILSTFSEWNGLKTSVGTFVMKLFDGVGMPLHPSFDLTVAFRSSCFGPNLQNQPRKPGVRECFVARPGRVFAAVDHATQEMRTWAQTLLDLFGESKLASRFQEDPKFDPHQEFADAQGSSRQHAKIANFGLPGGMGVKGLIRYAKGYGAEWDAALATEIRDGWFRQWPEARKYFNLIGRIVGGGEYGKVEIPRSGAWREGCRYTDASNTFFQSLAAHASKAGLFEVSRRCYDPTKGSVLYGSRPVNFVHDEIIAEVFCEVAHEAALEIAQVMEEEMAKFTPDIPTKTEAALMRHWSKKARPTFRDGRLIPYEDGEG